MPDISEIQLEGKSYSLDEFELGEMEWLYDELGSTLEEINPNSMKAAVRFVYLIKHREDPDFTMDDARKLKLAVFTEPEPEPEKKAPARRPTRAAKPAASA